MFISYLFLLLFPTALGSATPRSQCRCIYGDPCWPTDAEFSSLLTLLSQPLLHPFPTAYPCYPPSAPVGNCYEVQELYADGVFRSNLPGSMQNTNFEMYLFSNGTIDACYLNVTLNILCKQGSVPPIGVDIRKAEDAQAAVNFARQKNLRLVIKNTGHDYLGRSTGRGGFLLWTHHLKDKAYNAAFVLQGGPSTQTYEGKIEQISIDLIYAHFFFFQRSPSALVFNGLKHTSMSKNRADSLSVAYLAVVPLALQEVGLWAEDIAHSLQVSVSVRMIDPHQEEAPAIEPFF